MKNMDIETLLRWAYRDELPKAPRIEGPMAGVRSASSGWMRAAEMGAVLQETDIRNIFGLFPDIADREPHPDAVAISNAVEALADCDVVVPEGWDPLSDLGDLGQDGLDAVVRALVALRVDGRDGKRGLRRPVSRLVIRQALLGGCPTWEAEPPERRVVMTPAGRPAWFRRLSETTQGAFGPVTVDVEVDGYNHRSQRPFPGAYRKTILDPDPVSIVIERAEYELWRCALDLLVEDLKGRLVGRGVAPSYRSRRPWEVPDTAPRLLPSLSLRPLCAVPVD